MIIADIIKRLTHKQAIDEQMAYQVAYKAAKGMLNPAQLSCILTVLNSEKGFGATTSMLKYFQRDAVLHTYSNKLIYIHIDGLTEHTLMLAAWLKELGFYVLLRFHSNALDCPVPEGLFHPDTETELSVLTNYRLSVAKYTPCKTFREFEYLESLLGVPMDIISLLRKLVIPYRSICPVIETEYKEAYHLLRCYHDKFIICNTEAFNFSKQCLNLSSDDIKDRLDSIKSFLPDHKDSNSLDFTELFTPYREIVSLQEHIEAAKKILNKYIC